MAGLLPKRGSPVFLFRPLRQRLVWCGNFRGTMSSRAGSGNHWKKLENVQIFRLFLNSSWMLLPVREILFPHRFRHFYEWRYLLPEDKNSLCSFHKNDNNTPRYRKG